MTDGNERSALAVVRSLGRAGHVVAVAAKRGASLSAASRWCRREFVLPDPLGHEEAFADAVAATVKAEGFELVIPITDAAMLALLPRRDRLAPAVVPAGEAAAFACVSDKAVAAREAARLGIGVPVQAELASANAVAALDLPFPVVVKPARSVAGAGSGRRKHPVLHAADRGELDRALAQLPGSAWPVLVQQRIVGPGVGVFLLSWRGRLLATFMHRRLREKPPAGGVSVYATSIEPDAALIDRSRALVDALGWDGVAMVEYKVDHATGRPALMEINARFWGSLQLAIDAGVDFPTLLVAAARGETVQPVTQWRAGVRGRWFWGDVDHALTRLRRGDAALSMPRGAPGRVATLAAVLGTTLRAPHDQVFRLADPAPFFREIAGRLFGT